MRPGMTNLPERSIISASGGAFIRRCRADPGDAAVVDQHGCARDGRPSIAVDEREIFQRLHFGERGEREQREG